MAEELVTIKSFDYLPQAELAKLHLEEAGIPAFIADAETGTMLVANTVGFVKLQVSSLHAEAALAALAQRDEPNDSPADASPRSSQPEPIRCLSCGATIPAEKTVCPQCGWSYETAGGAGAAENQPN